MAEQKKVAFSTISSEKSEVKKRKVSRSIRLALTLPESNEKSCPEFNYRDLLSQRFLQRKREKRKVDGQILNGPMLDATDPFAADEDDALKALAWQLEKKYGKKRRKKDHDFKTLGEGYDETDPFIDNSDAVDDVVPTNMETKHGGFYINSGELDFDEVQISEDEQDETTDDVTIDDVQMKKKKRKNLITSDDEGVEENGKDDEEIDLKSNRENGILNKPKKRRLDEGELLRKRKKLIDQFNAKKYNKSEDGEIKAEGKEQTSSEKSIKDTIEAVVNMARESVATSPSAELENELNASKNEFEDKEDNKPLDDDTEKEVGDDSSSDSSSSASSDSDSSESSSSESESEKEDEENEVNKTEIEPNDQNEVINTVTSGTIVTANSLGMEDHGNVSENEKEVPLPDNLSADLILVLNRIKELGKNSKGSSQKFFTEAVNKMLFNIEIKVNKMGGRKKTQIYNHLSCHLPCGTQTLVKRGKLLLIDKLESRLKAPLTKLKEIIDGQMPPLIEKHALECQKLAQEKGENEKGKEENNEELLKDIKLPRKKFVFNNETRELLINVVKVRCQAFNVIKKRSETPEIHVRTFLEQQVKILWPKGWMTTKTLYKESAEAHSSITNEIPVNTLKQNYKMLASGVFENKDSSAITKSVTLPPELEIQVIKETDTSNKVNKAIETSKEVKLSSQQNKKSDNHSSIIEISIMNKYKEKDEKPVEIDDNTVKPSERTSILNTISVAANFESTPQGTSSSDLSPSFLGFDSPSRTSNALVKEVKEALVSDSSKRMKTKSLYDGSLSLREGKPPKPSLSATLLPKAKEPVIKHTSDALPIKISSTEDIKTKNLSDVKSAEKAVPVSEASLNWERKDDLLEQFKLQQVEQLVQQPKQVQSQQIQQSQKKLTQQSSKIQLSEQNQLPLFFRQSTHIQQSQTVSPTQMLQQSESVHKLQQVHQTQMTQNPQLVKSEPPQKVQPVKPEPEQKVQPVKSKSTQNPQLFISESASKTQPVKSEPAPKPQPVKSDPVQKPQPVKSDPIQKPQSVISELIQNTQPVKSEFIQKTQPVRSEPSQKSQSVKSDVIQKPQSLHQNQHVQIPPLFHQPQLVKNFQPIQSEPVRKPQSLHNPQPTQQLSCLQKRDDVENISFEQNVNSFGVMDLSTDKKNDSHNYKSFGSSLKSSSSSQQDIHKNEKLEKEMDLVMNEILEISKQNLQKSGSDSNNTPPPHSLASSIIESTNAKSSSVLHHRNNPLDVENLKSFSSYSEKKYNQESSIKNAFRYERQEVPSKDTHSLYRPDKERMKDINVAAIPLPVSSKPKHHLTDHKESLSRLPIVSSSLTSPLKTSYAIQHSHSSSPTTSHATSRSSRMPSSNHSSGHHDSVVSHNSERNIPSLPRSISSTQNAQSIHNSSQGSSSNVLHNIYPSSHSSTKSSSSLSSHNSVRSLQSSFSNFPNSNSRNHSNAQHLVISPSRTSPSQNLVSSNSHSSGHSHVSLQPTFRSSSHANSNTTASHSSRNNSHGGYGSYSRAQDSHSSHGSTSSSHSHRHLGLNSLHESSNNSSIHHHNVVTPPISGGNHVGESIHSSSPRTHSSKISPNSHRNLSNVDSLYSSNNSNLFSSSSSLQHITRTSLSSPPHSSKNLQYELSPKVSHHLSSQLSSKHSKHQSNSAPWASDQVQSSSFDTSLNPRISPVKLKTPDISYSLGSHSNSSRSSSSVSSKSKHRSDNLTAPLPTVPGSSHSLYANVTKEQMELLKSTSQDLWPQMNVGNYMSGRSSNNVHKYLPQQGGYPPSSSGSSRSSNQY